MPSQKTSGTQAATLTTEHTLATVTDAGIYVLAVDTNAMALADDLELRVKVKVLSGGTTREYLIGTYVHVQGQPVKMSELIPVLHEAVFTLLQENGTGRSYPWEIIEL